MGSGFAKKKKEAKALQEQFFKLQEEMKSVEVTGQAGGGLVELSLNGDHEITKLKINPECVDPEDIEGLEDLISAAHNEANQKLQKEASSSMPFPF